MQIAVTFRHLDASDALRDYAREKVLRLGRLLGDEAEARVVLSVEKFRHRAEVTLVARRLAVEGAEETEDMYAAIDLVTDKLEGQIRRVRQKRREGPRRKGEPGSRTRGTT